MASSRKAFQLPEVVSEFVEYVRSDAKAMGALAQVNHTTEFEVRRRLWESCGNIMLVGRSLQPKPRVQNLAKIDPERLQSYCDVLRVLQFGTDTTIENGMPPKHFTGPEWLRLLYITHGIDLKYRESQFISILNKYNFPRLRELGLLGNVAYREDYDYQSIKPLLVPSIRKFTTFGSVTDDLLMHMKVLSS
jgi:hypothetical protein